MHLSGRSSSEECHRKISTSSGHYQSVGWGIHKLNKTNKNKRQTNDGTKEETTTMNLRHQNHKKGKFMTYLCSGVSGYHKSFAKILTAIKNADSFILAPYLLFQIHRPTAMFKTFLCLSFPPSSLLWLTNSFGPSHPHFWSQVFTLNSRDSHGHIFLSIFVPRPHTNNLHKETSFRQFDAMMLKTKSFFRYPSMNTDTYVHIIYIYFRTVYGCHYLTWWICGRPNAV